MHKVACRSQERSIYFCLEWYSRRKWFQKEGKSFVIEFVAWHWKILDSLFILWMKSMMIFLWFMESTVIPTSIIIAISSDISKANGVAILSSVMLYWTISFPRLDRLSIIPDFQLGISFVVQSLHKIRSNISSAWEI